MQKSAEMYKSSYVARSVILPEIRQTRNPNALSHLPKGRMEGWEQGPACNNHE